MLLKKLKAKHDAMASTKLPPDEVAKLLKKKGVLPAFEWVRNARTNADRRAGFGSFLPPTGLCCVRRQVTRKRQKALSRGG